MMAGAHGERNFQRDNFSERALDRILRAANDDSLTTPSCLTSFRKCTTKICPVCGWEGDLAQLLNSSRKPRTSTVWSPQSGCTYCELRLRLAQKVAEPSEHFKILDSSRWLPWGPAAFDQYQIRAGPSGTKYYFSVFATTESGKSLPGVPRKRLVPEHTGSKLCMDEIRQQLDVCITKHTNCNKPDPHFRPKRLIYVHMTTDDTNDVVLVDEGRFSLGVRYLALSHCWGGVRPSCITESSSINTRRQRIPWNTLPQTFQDAIKFTRWLGINYIWIDSICIIQDDRDDRVREANKMFDVWIKSL